MLWLYRIFFLPVLIVLAPGYLRRMRRRGGYGNRFGERFGAGPLLPAKRPGHPRVWLQAVSVGEMLAIGPLLERLAAEGVEVYLTTTTSTGYRLAQERYAGRVAGLGYFPLDWWLFSARAWRRIDPDLAVLMEGERWPEHVAQAGRRGVPVIAVNARLSDRSFGRLWLWPRAARLVLGRMTRILAGSTQDAERFQMLGVPAERIVMTGNLKLDVTIPLLSADECAELRRELGLPPGLVLLGSSTWPGEEAALLTALQAARDDGLAVSLLLVPRHAERRAELAALLQGTSWRWHLRSQGKTPGIVEVAVADTTGELRRLTQLADLVFVGKSLPPHTEGQTPVEAAALGKPVVYGPGMGNFRVIAEELSALGAARSVPDAAALTAAVVALLREPAERAGLAAAAASWHRENAGAAERTMAVLRTELARRQ